MKDFLHTLFYWLNVRSWIRPILLLVTRRDVIGLENLPSHGAAILTSNHFSVGDPPILTGIMPRRVVWMAKQELFDAPLVGQLYYLGGFIPVRRFEADLRALRRAQHTLRRGHILGMFPEGTRSGGRLGRGEPGSALIALRTGAPVVPLAIWGTENVKLPRDFFRRTTVHVRIGSPFHLPRASKINKEDVAGGTREIMMRIAALLPEKYRGEYAGTEEAAQVTAAQGDR